MADHELGDGERTDQTSRVAGFVVVTSKGS